MTQEESQITGSKSEDLHILRLGFHDKATLLPLLYPVAAGWAGVESPWKVETVGGTPLELLNGLLEGRLDAALVTPLGVALYGNRLSPLGGWGLASEGISGMALLLSPQRLDLMDEKGAAIMPDAYGSTADHLLRLLLKPYYDIKLALRAPKDVGYDTKGIRLMYGDTAVAEARRKPKEWVAEDIGVAWFVFSGLPTVWEILAGPRDLEQRKPGAAVALQALLKQSQRTGQEQRASILAEASKRLGLEQTEVKELLARYRYTLGESEQKGMVRFLDQAARAGVLPK